MSRLVRHPARHGAWVLKGGTALSLFWLDVPRLSVDIDINDIGQTDLAAMQEARPKFEAAVAACCEREDCAVRRMPVDHAGGKLRLRYPTGIGGTSSLEVDLNFLLRRPLLPIEHRAPRFPPKPRSGSVPVLSLEEIAAGKFVALLSRQALRDAFDAAEILAVAPDLLGRRAFRLAFVCYAGANRQDLRDVDPARVAVSGKDVDRQLLPLLRVERRRDPDAASLAARLNETCVAAARQLVEWGNTERRFLDRLCDDGAIEPEHLTEDVAEQELIRRQPSLEWKALNVRRFKGR